ncbi:unnamed protein product, partial [Ectocarpus sp. 12 AP-2014]
FPIIAVSGAGTRQPCLTPGFSPFPPSPPHRSSLLNKTKRVDRNAAAAASGASGGSFLEVVVRGSRYGTPLPPAPFFLNVANEESSMNGRPVSTGKLMKKWCAEC